MHLSTGSMTYEDRYGVSEEGVGKEGGREGGEIEGGNTLCPLVQVILVLQSFREMKGDRDGKSAKMIGTRNCL